MMKKAIEKAVDSFLEKSKKRTIRIISHNDTDGITSAAILAKALRKLNKKFSVKIVKQLENDEIDKLAKNEDEILVFLDLGSGSLDQLGKLKIRCSGKNTPAHRLLDCDIFPFSTNRTLVLFSLLGNPIIAKNYMNIKNECARVK